MAFLAIFCVKLLGDMYIVSSIFALPDKSNAEELLKSDYELLETVVEYLENSEEESIHIHKTHTNDGTEDEVANKAIDKLFDKGYDSVVKRGNTIHFLRWTRWKDYGAGLAYSINGEDEPEMEYLHNLESLSKEKWYFYELS